jgi:uncharacterized pyridoxal phosphate-dependent enzyme
MMGKVARRDLLKQSGAALAAAPLLADAAVAAPAPLPTLTGLEPDNLFSRIGVRPLLNARGTYTIISGSRSLPEVKRAMWEASHYYVDLDEMMQGIGAQLARLTGAPWGIATNGAESAIVQATIACIADANVEKCQALPYIKTRDQVIIPRHSRNPYDIGVRMVGAEIVEVGTAEELRAQISPHTAMIYVMSGPRAASGPLGIANICAIAKEHGIPVLVDAAAEEPVRPNIHLAAGASLVCYSGGKCLRGPQSSGMLIGDKSLCQAAYYQAAPHHCYGRALKCSKEEAMGLLAAVEQWYKRDHDAEQAMWHGWLDTVANRVKPLPSIGFEYLQPVDLSNKSARLRIRWDGGALGITGTELVELLDKGTPRILVEGGTGARPDDMASSITIMPYMMDPGEDHILAEALYQALSHPRTYANPVVPAGAPAPVAGTWAVTVQYLRGTGEQRLTLVQNGNDVAGVHQGEIYSGKVGGTVHASQIALSSRMVVPGNGISWTFHGTVEGNAMHGKVNMGEYGDATWTAVRA